jgi:hypothetical protein
MYDKPTEYNFSFGWFTYHPAYYILKGNLNDFSSIWADPRASMSTGKFYASTQDAFSIVNIEANIVIDYYNTTHSGLRGEALTSNDVIDLYIQGAP